MSIGPRGGSPADERAQSSVRVLIVDDALAFRRVICELLQCRGYQVAGEARTGAQAVELTKKLEPDAVLLDVHLPDANGFELAARLSRAHPSVAILLTSIDVEGDFYARAHASGARGFVRKPELAGVEFARFWPGCGRG